jgi:hypothetical protein
VQIRLRRLGGSIGLAAAARSVLLLARDPDDPEGITAPMRFLAQSKSNLGLLEPSLAFRIKPATLANHVTTASLTAAGASRFSATELLALNETEARSKLSEAEALLVAELEDGPRPVSELRAAGLELGIVGCIQNGHHVVAVPGEHGRPSQACSEALDLVTRRPVAGDEQSDPGQLGRKLFHGADREVVPLSLPKDADHCDKGLVGADPELLAQLCA